MNDQTSSIPTLTLDPNAAAATQAAVEEAPVEEVSAAPAEVKTEKPDLSALSDAEQAAVRDFSEKIDITNTEQVMNYGAAAQKNISEFSDAALGTVRTKDLGEVGDMLGDLVVELQGLNFTQEEKKGLRGLFKKATKDISMMDKMYDKNQEYMKELTMYILAGKLKIEQLRNVELPKYIQHAQETGLPEDAQAANDFANLIGRFEKKIHDLELTRQISVQMAPQIRLIQNNDSLMVEKIRSSIVNTIPLWKNQMVLGLSMFHSEQAMKAQREVTDTTNALLMQNAQALHQGSVSVAKESERGIVDIETLKKTNQELIKTLDEVRQIQDAGRASRAQAEAELTRIEDELMQKLLDMKG